MNRRAVLGLFTLAPLVGCGASVFPEIPLTEAEQRFADAIAGYWYGAGDFVLVDGTMFPGADVRTAWWQLRLTQTSVRRFRMNWSIYLRDIEAVPAYELLLSDQRLIVDPNLRVRGMVSEARYEGHTFTGGVELRGDTLAVDITMSQQFLGPLTTHLERRRLTIAAATRARP